MKAPFAEHRLAFRTLITMQVFVAVTAIIGGIMLMRNAYGSVLVPLDMLEITPFRTFMIPGLLLLLVVGLSAAVASIFLLRQGAVGAWAAGIASSILTVWIVSEAVLLDTFHVLQAFYATIGVFEIFLSWLMISLTRRAPELRR